LTFLLEDENRSSIFLTDLNADGEWDVRRRHVMKRIEIWLDSHWTEVDQLKRDESGQFEAHLARSRFKFAEKWQRIADGFEK
jgi:hypothetical protein